MAAIDDLIEQIEDKALRERLKFEANRLTKSKKFGLVFEEHLPELTPIHNAKVRKNSKVALRDAQLVDLWRVISLNKDKAHCRNIGSGETRQIPVNDLIVVRQFGEPIFPTLVSIDKVQNGPDNAPWHTLIEADNYHALQLLEYLYAGKVDCIYIDPPYNTGAKDWKYNNDYVDANDSWRHSKWLAMMRRRLLLSKRLLNPDTGVLVVTIDEHEVHHLRMLLEQIFPEKFLQMVTAVVNPKGVTQGRFSRVEEYLLFCFANGAGVKGGNDDFLNPINDSIRPRWKGLLRSGTNARRADRKNMFYPLLVDENAGSVIGTGVPLPFKEEPEIGRKIDGYFAAWPIRTDGSWGNWGVGHQTLRKLISKGYVSLGRFDPKRNTYGITYLSQQLQKEIETGKLEVVDFDNRRNVVDVVYTDSAARKIKTVWHRSLHDAGAYGADLVSKIIGQSRAFSFPKSLYAVRDSIACLTREKKDAIVLDFFAGSGTTLHAVNLLNFDDGGSRQCIMVTNNEVSEEDAKELRKQGYRPGQEAWESKGICKSVTWPRCKYTILGKRIDGSEFEGEYISGKMHEKEKARKFNQIAFTSIGDLSTATKKKQLVTLIEGIPQSLVKKDSAFIVSDKHPASILFEESKAEEWIEALEGNDHITNFYIVTPSKATFDDIQKKISGLLGPMIVMDEGKYPMRDGFPANIEYYKLDFLDKDHVALGRQFREILPILWMRAGAIGPPPILPKNRPIPAMVFPKHNPFAVLVDETRFADFTELLTNKNSLTHVFLVTDSEEAFQEMAVQMNIPNVIHLYRDYLENFVINKGECGP